MKAGPVPIWTVYGGQPLPRPFLSKRGARRLMRRYARLGIQASLYAGDDLVERRDKDGKPYRLNETREEVTSDGNRRVQRE